MDVDEEVVDAVEVVVAPAAVNQRNKYISKGKNMRICTKLGRSPVV